MGEEYEGGNSSRGFKAGSEPHVLQLDSYTLVQQPRSPPSLSTLLHLAEPWWNHSILVATLLITGNLNSA